MADLASVETALVSAIADVLFPDTSYAPYSIAVSSSTGINCRLFRGWPVDNQLVADLKAGVTNISVFSAPGVARDVTNRLRNSAIWNISQVTPTMTATLAGSQVTFDGTTNIGQTIGIGVRKRGGGYGFSTRLLDIDTPTSVAARFASNMTEATSSGPILTIAPTLGEIVVAVGGDVTTVMEVHRNDQQFLVTIWAPTVTIRDQICNFIDPNLIVISHLMFPDGSVSDPIRGAGTMVDDIVQKEYMWKRTLMYMITYPTMYTKVYPVMTLGEDILSSSITLID